MDSRHRLPVAIERLVDELGSVGALELLLLLRDADPEPRGLGEICSELRCPQSWAEFQLRRLCGANLIATDADGGFSYAPRSDERAEEVGELARLWGEERRAITGRMLAPPNDPRRARLRAN